MEKLYEKYLSEGNKLKIDTNNLSIYAKVIDHGGVLEGDKQAEEYFLDDMYPLMLEFVLKHIEEKFKGESSRIVSIDLIEIKGRIYFDIEEKTIFKISPAKYVVFYDDNEEEEFSETLHSERMDIDLEQYF